MSITELDTERRDRRGAKPGKRTPRPVPDGLPRFLTRQQIVEITGVSFASIWQWMQDGEFPRARRIGRARTGWLESEIQEWAASRPVAKLKGDDADEARQA